ncbi:RNA polymerase sigma factor [Pararhizobium haloflavum]|uniref:RNA polymerase sigma factor n=1 Tax=Pararhizobium haloflavum TaxID=2037914 RepID=UPI000C18365D|nr:RNA polymerase sigma factor [Pararhizobium haloflavum]
MTADPAWIEKSLTAARPRAVAALLRYFRDLDRAEEAFQEASLKALSAWPKNGPPRDPTAWLIFVGRNAGIDAVRKVARHTELPDEDAISDLSDAEADMADRLDDGHYRDDILRLLFVCCHPDLPATQQIALALRIVSGLSVARIARAFLVSDSAMEQRITRAKAKIGRAGVAFETPDADARAARLGAVGAMIYLVFNEGYSARASDLAGGGKDEDARRSAALFAEEAIRLARLLTGLFPSEPEVMGLLSLLLLQHARSRARFDAKGEIVLLEDQDRGLWDRTMIAEGLAMIDKAIRHRAPGPYQIQAAIAALHARAQRPELTDWAGIDQLYATLERIQPSPVVSLSRAVATHKLHGAQAALAAIAPLADRLAGYFYFHGLRGGLLRELGRIDEAREAFDRAIALATTTAEASHIRQHLDGLCAAPQAPKTR